MKKEIGTEEFKRISLDILIAVHEFCEENNIKYSLACGTLIGAVRHKGFIPWDDDVDIYMIRDDYNQFISSFPNIYKEKYAILCMENNPEWHYSFAKVHDIRTIQIEENLFPIKNMGVAIDVFPIDNAPDNDFEWKKYERRRKILRDIYSVKELGWRNGRKLWKNIFAILCSTLLRPVKYRKLAEMLNSYAQKYNNIETKYYAENCVGRPNNRFPKEDFSNCIDLLFENHKFMAMQNYNDYLTRFYGDYMTLPPLEKRRTHYRTISYWK